MKTCWTLFKNCAIHLQDTHVLLHQQICDHRAPVEVPAHPTCVWAFLMNCSTWEAGTLNRIPLEKTVETDVPYFLPRHAVQSPTPERAFHRNLGPSYPVAPRYNSPCTCRFPKASVSVRILAWPCTQLKRWPGSKRKVLSCILATLCENTCRLYS